MSSVRLEAVTNGIEDYEYLTIEKQIFGEDFTDETISKITQDLVTYTLSDKQFAKVRIELGNAIEQAVSAK